MLIGLLRRLAAPRTAQVSFSEAFRLYTDGDDAAAEAACRALIARGESVADASFLSALIARRRGRTEEAIAKLRRAVEENPEEAAYWLTLGELLLSEGRAEAAVSCLERGAGLASGGAMHADALCDLGRAYLLQSGRGENAHDAFRRALEADPRHPGALRGHAMLLHSKGDIENARSVALGCIAGSRDAAGRLRRALLLPPLLASIEEIQAVRRRFDAELSEMLLDPLDPVGDPVNDIGLTPLYLAYHGLNDRPLLEKLCRVVRRCYAGAGASPRLSLRARGRRRVGFVSTNFYLHSIGRTTLGWIQDLPRQEFEVTVFSIAPPAGDPMAERIGRAADHYAVLPANLERVRRAIVEAELDFLVFADIGLHPLTYFLAYWRMAPVQLAAWGHPVTTGIDTVDYWISAESLELPEADVHYSERLLRLKRYFMPRYSRPAAPARRATPADYGLPADAHLYACPQTLVKMHPDFDDVIARLLERDASAHVILLELYVYEARTLSKRLAPRLGRAMERVRFLKPLPHAAFLDLVAGSHVLLDPFHFGGNNSTAEALALGVPVVTLPGTYLRGRFTLGLYNEIGCRECVAGSTAEYVEMALRFGTEPDARQQVRSAILRESGRLFDRPDAGAALGEALLQLCASRRMSGG